MVTTTLISEKSSKPFLNFLYRDQESGDLENDSLLTNIAGVLALLIAFFPTNPDTCSEKIYTIAPWCLQWLGWLHYFFAALFFLILADISINVFTIGQKTNIDIPVSMLNENYLYRICGYAIIIFVCLIPVCDLLDLFPYSTLVFEAFWNNLAYKRKSPG